MDLQHLMSFVRRAADNYNMIQEGDKIAVGLSGGKDSLALLTALAAMRRFYPHHYELCAITVSLGFDMDFTPVVRYCEALDVPLSIVETDIGRLIFESRKEENPCSLCSKMRKGALNSRAVELNCNKTALGHNRDDTVETMLMSLIFEGRLHTFAPVTFLDRTGLHAVRPLIYAREKDIKAFVVKNNLPVIKNACPADKNTKRQEIKGLISKLSREYPDLQDKAFGAIQRSSLTGWKI